MSVFTDATQAKDSVSFKLIKGSDPEEVRKAQLLPFLVDGVVPQSLDELSTEKLEGLYIMSLTFTDFLRKKILQRRQLS